MAAAVAVRLHVRNAFYLTPTKPAPGIAHRGCCPPRFEQKGPAERFSTVVVGCSGSGLSVGVSGGDGAFAEFGQHGGVVDVEVFADSCE
jgi:hypothetical protein